MGIHPNAILGVRLTPDDLARKTYRAILEFLGEEDEDPDLKLGEDRYHIILMEDVFHDSYQIKAKEGDIVIFTFLTYGYGDTCLWDDAVEKKVMLEGWVREAAKQFKLTPEFFLTANYW